MAGVRKEAVIRRRRCQGGDLTPERLLLVVQKSSRPCKNLDSKVTVRSRREPNFAIFSDLRGHRPQNSGSAEREAEFSHGLQEFCRPERCNQCGGAGRSFTACRLSSPARRGAVVPWPYRTSCLSASFNSSSSRSIRWSGDGARSGSSAAPPAVGSGFAPKWEGKRTGVLVSQQRAF